MPKLLIDTTRLVGRLMKGRLPTGIDRVCLAYLRQYGSIAQAIMQKGPFRVILSQVASQDLFAQLLHPDGHSARRAAGILAKSLFRPQREASCSSLVLNLGHSGLESRGYVDWLREARLRPVFMVHDLIPLTHPQYCRRGEQTRHLRRMQTILRAGAAVMTNSIDTLHTLSAHAASRGISMPPALAAPLAGALACRTCGDRPVAEPYFAMLSTIEPRKNHSMILHIWQRLIERYGKSAPRLVVIGQRGWSCDGVMELLTKSDILRGFVVHRPQCSDAELGTYLCHAQALLFPSFAEGYGLPLVEALSLGVPAIASDLAVFRETNGDIPEYIDAVDEVRWMKRIEAYCAPHSDPRAAQLKRLRKFVAPTWAAHFRLFEDLLAQAC
jgi:hypothetical protein